MALSRLANSVATAAALGGTVRVVLVQVFPVEGDEFRFVLRGEDHGIRGQEDVGFDRGRGRRRGGARFVRQWFRFFEAHGFPP